LASSCEADVAQMDSVINILKKRNIYRRADGSFWRLPEHINR